MTRYRISDHVFDDGSERFGEVLARAFAARLRPYCLCHANGVEMYLSRFEDRVLIKRMPGSGSSHDPGCEHFEAPATLSGLGDVLGKAIEEREDGTSVVKLGFSLTRTGAHVAPAESTSQTDTVTANPSRLTLRSLLHYLWHEAGLVRWVPGFEGKRSWYRVRSLLTEAASGMQAKKLSLAERLPVPETFRRDQADEIQGRRRAFLSRFRPDRGDRRDMVIIVGELIAIDPSRYGFSLRLKHMVDCPLHTDADMVKRLNRRFATEFEIAGSVDTVHLVMIATASVNRAGHVLLEEASLMLADENWIPFENIDERDFVAQLVATKRSFMKGLRFNVEDRPLANVLLSDVTPPVAMYVLSSASDEHDQETIHQMTADNNLGLWIWDVSTGAWPAIPERTGKHQTLLLSR